MNRFFASIEIIRPLNMILCLLSVFISAWLLDGMTSPLLPYAALVVFCFSGASNILNDVLDIHIDEINRPDRVLTSGRLRIWDALILMSIMYAIGIIATTYLLPVGRQIALVLVLPLLVLYTPLFKPLPLIGNLVVGLILGLVFLFTEGAIYDNVDKMCIPFCLAAGLSTIRELVKDVADMEGDALINLQTFPRKFGLLSTLWLLRILAIFLCLFAFMPVLEGYYGKVYLILLVFLVEVPILWVVFVQLNEVSTVSDYKRTAYHLKGVTIGGLLVIFSTGF